MKVAALAPGYRLKPFRCGEPAIDRYLAGRAKRDMERSLAAVFVLLLPDEIVAGFYVLAPATIFLPDLLAGSERKTSRYPPMPAARLSRLVVDQRHRGQGAGRYLLGDALGRVSRSAFGSVAVIAEAADEATRGFYLREGFLAFPDRADRLFRPVTDFGAG